MKKFITVLLFISLVVTINLPVFAQEPTPIYPSVNIEQQATLPSLPVVKTIKATALANGKIQVTWSKSAGATSYMLYRSTNKDRGFKALMYSNIFTVKNPTTMVDNFTKKGTMYYYKVKPLKEIYDPNDMLGEYECIAAGRLSNAAGARAK